jgi:hypothetical protein
VKLTVRKLALEIIMARKGIRSRAATNFLAKLPTAADDPKAHRRRRRAGEGWEWH